MSKIQGTKFSGELLFLEEVSVVVAQSYGNTSILLPEPCQHLRLRQSLEGKVGDTV